MSQLLQEITDNYINELWDNSNLFDVLNQLDGAQLQIVIYHIKRVEREQGECKLRRVTENSSGLVVRTDHPDDGGADYARNTYR